MTDPRRAIPSVERLLSTDALQPLLARQPRSRVVEMLRLIQDEQRDGSNGGVPHDAGWYAAQVEERLRQADAPSLRDVINASGVILHTNLGRAPLSSAALAAINLVSGGYSNLEYDLDAGSRGSRYNHCEALLTALTGAEAALVTNNNAAALVLVLNTIAQGRPVIISRGELVEIGDSFRVPEIIGRSGAVLCEVGATNRTHLADYERHVIGAGAILKVHPSNFRTTGFVAEATIAQLAPLARSAGIPLIHDLGSGLIESLDDIGLPHEPTAAEAVAQGADVVTMSGDKLLGGPQAGIIVGRREIIVALKRNPLCRALRVDKLTLAALEATLQSYRRGTARVEIPVLRMIAATADELHERAQQLAVELRAAGLDASVVPGSSRIGGGAYPEVELPTSLVAVAREGMTATELEARLRRGATPIVARVLDDRVAIDLRTVPPEQQELLARLIADAS
jgi:L-seryl-tRNA(Ser) seleniumtransferase